MKTSIRILTALIGLLSAQVKAGDIQFEATDLPDLVVGADLWQYSYNVHNFSFAVNEGFTIFFDLLSYEQLEDPPPPVNPDWDAISIQPDPGLDSDGFYDAQALVSSPSLADAFTIQFVWTGTGSPGSQPFTIYDANFNTVFSGQTIPIPEPAVIPLAIVGAALFAMRSRRNARMFSICVLGLLVSQSCTFAEPTVIGKYPILSSTRVGRTIFRYVMRPRLMNDGPAMTNVTATVTSTSPNTQVVKNAVTFGNVPATSTVAATDTFTINHDRRFPFDPSALQWALAADPIEVSATIGSSGGTISFPDGAQLLIPSGALQTNTTITMRRTFVNAAEADTVAQQGDIVYDLQPNGLSFASPAQITLPIRSGESDDEAIILIQHNPGDTWVPAMPVGLQELNDDDHAAVDPFPIDSATQTVSGQLMHFSRPIAIRLARTEFVNEGGQLSLVQRERRGANVNFILNRFPFTAINLGDGVIVQQFLITESHSPAQSPGLIWQGKAQTWPAFAKPIRNPAVISHIVMHDYGNDGQGNRISAEKAVRNLLNHSISTGAPYYIAINGTIFQLAEEDHVMDHVRLNNTSSVGIEMEPTSDDGGIAEETVNAAAALGAHLIKVLHLPFDPEIEVWYRQPTVVNGRFVSSGNMRAALPNEVRNVVFAAHGEIQSNRTDPRGLDWFSFLDEVSAGVFPGNVFGPNGSLVDCSAQNSSNMDDLDGQDVSFQTVKDLSAGSLGTVNEFPPQGGSSTLASGTYRKIYIPDGTTVVWNAGGGDVLNCGSFYLGRGATLKVNSASGGSATIKCERILQIDGFIDASGRDNPTTRKALGLTLQTGAGEVFRVPSIISRGANSTDPTVAGGAGGAVSVTNSYPNSQLMIFGAGPHNFPNFQPSYNQRLKTDYSGYGGTSFSIEPGTLSIPGIITSGGGGAGGVNDLQPGGDGGDITIAGGSTARIRFDQTTQLMSGAGTAFDTPGFGSYSPLEILQIDYQSDLLTEIFPAGGNGGRGRSSFGNITGGNGGDGGDAGAITVTGTTEVPISGVSQRQVSIMDDGMNTRYPPRTNRPQFILSDAQGQALWISAIGGSGGPHGGDSFSAYPGDNGKKGHGGSIQVLGLGIMNPD